MLRRRFGGPRLAAAKSVTQKVVASGDAGAGAASTPSTAAVPASIAPPTAAAAASDAPSATPDNLLPPQAKEGVRRSPSVNRTPEPKAEQAEATEPVFKESRPSSRTTPVPAVSPTSGSRQVVTRVRTLSHLSSSSATSVEAPRRRRRRIFASDEPYDAAKLTMSDLIDWKPKAENTLRKKWDDLEKRFREEGFNGKKEKVESTEQSAVGPRVKLDEDGNVIIDEASLVVRANPEEVEFETVDDDLLPKKLNSLSFRKNLSRMSAWSDLETELFYELLSSTGTDFSLVHEYMPFKTRQDIKKKFRKEEKLNIDKINDVLRHPARFDEDAVKKRIENLLKRIDVEHKAIQEKRDKRLGRKQAKEARNVSKQQEKREQESPTSDDETRSHVSDATASVGVTDGGSQRVLRESTNRQTRKRELSTSSTTTSVREASLPSKKKRLDSDRESDCDTKSITSTATRRSQRLASLAPSQNRPPVKSSPPSSQVKRQPTRNEKFADIFAELKDDFPIVDIMDDDATVTVPSLKKSSDFGSVLRLPTDSKVKIMPITLRRKTQQIAVITPSNAKFFVNVVTDGAVKSLQLNKI